MSRSPASGETRAAATEVERPSQINTDLHVQDITSSGGWHTLSK